MEQILSFQISWRLAEGVLNWDVLCLLPMVSPVLAVDPRFFMWCWLHGSQARQRSLWKLTFRILLHSSECMPYKNWSDYPETFLYHLSGLKTHEKNKIHSADGVIVVSFSKSTHKPRCMFFEFWTSIWFSFREKLFCCDHPN